MNNNTVPWSIKGHKGRERMEKRILDELMQIQFQYTYEKYNEDIHGVAYGNLTLVFLFQISLFFC